MASRPRHTRAAQTSTAPPPSDSTTRLQGLFLTVIGLAGIVGGVLFSIEAPRFTPVPVVFLTFWLVMVIVGRILFTGLDKLRNSGANTPTSEQARAAAAVAGIVIAVGMMGFTATSAGAGSASAAPCPGGGPATCGPTGPDLTFAPPTGQATAPGQQPGQQGGQDQQGIATSPARGGDNGPGIQAQTPEFGTPGQQAPNIPGNEQPGQGSGQQGQQPQGNGQGQQNQNPAVQTTAPGGPQQTGQQQPGQQTQSGQPSTATITVTTTQSECPMPGAPGANGDAPGGTGTDGSDSGGSDTDTDSDSENKDGPPSWAYLVAEATGIMAGGRTRRRPTPGAVTSQLSSETLTDTTTATKASTQYYSSAQINPSPSGDMEPLAPNIADAPPSHQPMQPPSTGSGIPGASSGQGGPVGTSPGRGIGTGGDNGSTPTPVPGSSDPGTNPANLDWPDAPGVPDPGLPKPGSGFVEGPIIVAIPAIISIGIALATAILGTLIAALVGVIIWIGKTIDALSKLIPPLTRAINDWLGGGIGDTLDDLLKGLPEQAREGLRKWLEENLPKLIDKLREAGLLPAAPAAPGGGATPAAPPNPGTATPDVPTSGNPGTPLPGQPRPPITPKPTTPPDPGKIPAPGRIDPETGLPVIPQPQRPSTTPQPGTGSAPSASNGGTNTAPPTPKRPRKSTIERIAQAKRDLEAGRITFDEFAETLRAYTPNIGGNNQGGLLQGLPRPQIGDPNPARPGTVIQQRIGAPAGTSDVSPDHITPFQQIIRMPGFLKLTPQEMYDVINWQGNLQWLASLDNSTKGARSAATMAGFWDPSFIAAQVALEKSTSAALQALIDSLTRGR